MWRGKNFLQPRRQRQCTESPAQRVLGKVSCNPVVNVSVLNLQPKEYWQTILSFVHLWRSREQTAKMCNAIAKSITTIFNFIFFVMGVGFIVVGSLIAVGFRDLATAGAIKAVYVWAPSSVVIVIGMIMCIAAILGCFGVLTENPCALKSYLAFLLIAISIQIAAAILVVHYGDKIETELTETFQASMMVAYSKMSPNTVAANVLDNYQRHTRCCGATGPADYLKADIVMATTRLSPPDSCCTTFASGCSNNLPFNGTGFYQDGCITEIENLYQRYSVVVLATGISFIVLEVFALIYAFGLCFRRNTSTSTHNLTV